MTADAVKLAPSILAADFAHLGDQVAEAERAAWMAASQTHIASAYGAHEPDYSDVVLREKPPGK